MSHKNKKHESEHEIERPNMADKNSNEKFCCNGHQKRHSHGRNKGQYYRGGREPNLLEKDN